MKRLIITESEKNNIRKMYGLILEQASGNLVPQSVYDAISQIESKYSYMNNGKIVGATYSGNKIEGDFKKYIEKYIGLENWFKMSDKLRGQIYAFAFQSDSGEGGVYKNKWIAGLAQAIGNYDRTKISNKNIGTPKDPKFIPVNDPDVQNAINIIKAACQDGTINTYYDKYLSILDQQYKSSDYNENYKYIWKYRPTAIERFMNGEKKDDIFKDWDNSFGTQQKGQQTQQQGQQTQQQVQQQTQQQTQIKDIDINLGGDGDVLNYTKFYEEIKKQTKNALIDRDSIELDFQNRTFSVKKGQEKIFVISLIIGRDLTSKNIKAEDDFNNRLNSVIKNNEKSYSIEPFDVPITCSDCMTENGNPIKTKYQLIILKEKNTQ